MLDRQRGLVTASAGLLGLARSGHDATLLPDGRVLIAHGVDGTGSTVDTAEIFDPTTQAFATAPPTTGAVSDPALVASIPADGATDVPPTEPISLRFAAPVQVESLSGPSVVLIGTTGGVEARVVAAEGGRLVFLHPTAPLRAGATYQVLARGLTDVSGNAVPDAAVAFTVARADEPVAPTSDDESVNGINSPWRTLAPLQAPAGVTAVAGQVLQLNGAPLPGVTLRIEDHETRTDRTGRFLLTAVPAGHHELVIDGRTASTPGRDYGVFEYGLKVQAGKTNVLPFTSWMPRIDTAHAVHISSPTTANTVVTSPDIPGLELHVPAGTVIKDIDGKVATKISITPIPVDRPPFPLPDTRYVPIYFTIQPGGGYVYSKAGTGVRLHYPNYQYSAPGSTFGFWHYDPEDRGWFCLLATGRSLRTVGRSCLTPACRSTNSPARWSPIPHSRRRKGHNHATNARTANRLTSVPVCS